MDWVFEKLIETIKRYKTADPFEIANARNIIVRFLPLGQTYGFYLRSTRQQIIHINSDIEEFKWPFICSHELSHSIIHPNSNTPFLDRRTLISKGKIESQANAWATGQVLFLNDASIKGYETSHHLLKANAIPLEMERFISTLPDELF